MPSLSLFIAQAMRNLKLTSNIETSRDEDKGRGKRKKFKKRFSSTDEPDRNKTRYVSIRENKTR